MHMLYVHVSINVLHQKATFESLWWLIKKACLNNQLGRAQVMWRFAGAPPATFVHQNAQLYTACLRTWAPGVTFSLDSKGYACICVHALMSSELPLIVHTTSEVLVKCSVHWGGCTEQCTLRTSKSFCWHVESYSNDCASRWQHWIACTWTIASWQWLHYVTLDVVWCTDQLPTSFNDLSSKDLLLKAWGLRCAHNTILGTSWHSTN